MSREFLFYEQSGNPSRVLAQKAPERIISKWRAGASVPRGTRGMMCWTPGSPSSLKPPTLLEFQRSVGAWAQSEDQLLVLDCENATTSASRGCMQALEWLAREQLPCDVHLTSYPYWWKNGFVQSGVLPLMKSAGMIARLQCYLAPGKKSSNRWMGGAYGVRWAMDGCSQFAVSNVASKGVAWSLDVAGHHLGMDRRVAGWAQFYASQGAGRSISKYGADSSVTLYWSSAWLSTPRVEAATAEDLRSYFRMWEQPTQGRPRERVASREWDKTRAAVLGSWVKLSQEK